MHQRYKGFKSFFLKQCQLLYVMLGSLLAKLALVRLNARPFNAHSERPVTEVCQQLGVLLHHIVMVAGFTRRLAVPAGGNLFLLVVPVA